MSSVSGTKGELFQLIESLAEAGCSTELELISLGFWASFDGMLVDKELGLF